MKTLIVRVVPLLFACVSATALSQSTAPNDAQIAGIVVAANMVDIDAGKLAEGKAQDMQVKQFARQMVTDHTGVNQQATALVKKLQVTPQDSATSKSLKDAGKVTQDKLTMLVGREFDKAYVDNEVTYHQTVIEALDKTLIPNAKNAELKDLLIKVRPAFVAHLEHAKQIQTSLK